MKATKKFLSRLRSRMFDNGMLQLEVSKRSRINESKLSRFLHGHVQLTEEEIQRLQDALEKK